MYVIMIWCKLLFIHVSRMCKLLFVIIYIGAITVYENSLKTLWNILLQTIIYSTK